MTVETKEWTELDRKGWPSGPWDKEPDRKQWLDQATGFACLIVRGHRGNLCGYVGVPEGHPAYQRDYNDVSAGVHGGLTYADHCSGRICHEVDGDDRVWWLGFDCLHSGDAAPKMFFDEPDARYRDFPYVESECRKLAEQLHAMTA